MNEGLTDLSRRDVRFHTMRREIYYIFILLLVSWTLSNGSTPNEKFSRQREEVSADTLARLLSLGYEISLNECNIMGRFVYHGRVQKTFLVINSVFKNAFDFGNAIFSEDLYLEGSTFLDSVSFDNARFGGFTESNRSVSFTRVKFEGPVSFSNIKFLLTTYFNEATFKQYANFANTTFSKHTDFWGTTFEGYADFVRVRFNDYAGFTDANFDALTKYQRHDAKGSFDGSHLPSVNFRNATLSKIIMDPDSISAFSMSSLAFAKGLRELRFYRPEVLSIIKSYYRLNHYRQAEREITCAIKRKDQNSIEKIAFDYTSEYGSNFIRPIKILFGIWVVCSVIYFCLFRIRGKSGLMITTTSFNNGGQSIVKREVINEYVSPKLFSNIGYAFLFSLISTFNIGFRDYDFGRIIRLLLTREKDFRPTGLLRTFSAIQAIVSVFLIVLWIFSYFGRPFD